MNEHGTFRLIGRHLGCSPRTVDKHLRHPYRKMGVRDRRGACVRAADAYDNAIAEALNSLFKAECICDPVMCPKGGWKSVSDVEIAVAEYVEWFNHRRLHDEIGLIPPAE